MPPKFQIDPNVARGTARRTPSVAAPPSAANLIAALEGFAAKMTERLQGEAVQAGARLGAVEQQRTGGTELVRRDAGGVFGLDNPAFEAFNEAARATYGIQLRTDFIEASQRLAVAHQMDPERLRDELNHASTQILESARGADPSGALTAELIPELADITNRAYTTVLSKKLERDWEALGAEWDKGIRRYEDFHRDDLLSSAPENFVGEVNRRASFLGRLLDKGVALGRASQADSDARFEDTRDQFMEMALRGNVNKRFLPTAHPGTDAWQAQADTMRRKIIVPMIEEAAFIRDEAHRLRLAKEFERMLQVNVAQGRANLDAFKSRVGRIMTAVHRTGGTPELLTELKSLTDQLQILDDDPGKWRATFRGANLAHIISGALPGTTIAGVNKAQRDLPSLVSRLDLVSESTNTIAALYDRHQQSLEKAATATNPMDHAAEITRVPDPTDAFSRATEDILQDPRSQELSPAELNFAIRTDTVRRRVETLAEQRRLMAESLGRPEGSIIPVSSALAENDLAIFQGFIRQGDTESALSYAQAIVDTLQNLDPIGWQTYMGSYDRNGKQWGSILTAATLVAELQPAAARALIEAQVTGPQLSVPETVSKTSFIDDLKTRDNGTDFAQLRALDFSPEAQEILGDTLWNLYKLEASRGDEFDPAAGQAAVDQFMQALPRPDSPGTTLPTYLPQALRLDPRIDDLQRLSTVSGLNAEGVDWDVYHFGGSPEVVIAASRWELVGLPGGRRVMRLRYRNGRNAPWLADTEGNFIEVDISDLSPELIRSPSGDANARLERLITTELAEGLGTL